VTFRITHHAGGGNPPPDALDRLFEQLPTSRDDVSFSKSSDHEIAAFWTADVSSSMASDERSELGRRVVLDIVRDVCELNPALDLEWFAISKMPESHERGRNW